MGKVFTVVGVSMYIATNIFTVSGHNENSRKYKIFDFENNIRLLLKVFHVIFKLLETSTRSSAFYYYYYIFCLVRYCRCKWQYNAQKLHSI